MPEPIRITYDPFLLPTAQHRAGLAGLLVHQDTLRRRGLGPVIEATEDSDGRWTLAFTEESLVAAFNDLYDASWEERTQKQKRTKGKGAAKTIEPPKREERQMNAKTQKEETVYVYDQVTPRGAFLTTLGLSEPWLKLWREAIWQTLRGVPKTRLPYELRAARQSCEEAEHLWAQLSAPSKKRARSPIETLSGSLLLGANATHADNIPFQGRMTENLLLHFWPITMGTFVPVKVDRDGKQEHDGFVLTVPDIEDVAAFVEDFPGYLSSLSGSLAGFRPRDSLIAIPAEAGFAYGRALASVARARSEVGELSYSSGSFEIYHLRKGERAAAMLRAGRVTLSRAGLHDYELIRQEAQDPRYRRQLVLNLLSARPWYACFDQVFASAPYTQFAGAGASLFVSDIRRTWRRLEAFDE